MFLERKKRQKLTDLVYNTNGAEINDKHSEISVRKYLKQQNNHIIHQMDTSILSGITSK